MCTVLKVIQNVKKYDLFRVKIAHSIHLFFGGKADLQELYLILSILKKIIQSFLISNLHLQYFLSVPSSPSGLLGLQN